MRQRVLLVAGWFIAAVVTSLVASGAVAVAGGQVFDRPLRPLTAAEVVDLPVVVTPDTSGACEPLASGGFACGPDVDVAGVVVNGPGTGDGSAPVGGREGTGDGTPSGVPRTLDPEVPPDGLPPITGIPDAEDPDTIALELEPVPSEGAVVRLEGGSVSIAGGDDRLFFFWAISAPGYFSNVQFGDEPDTLVVIFSNANDESRLEAAWVDDELILEVFERVR